MPVIRDHKGLAKFVPAADQSPDPVDLPDSPEDSGLKIDVTDDGTVVTTMPDGTVVIGGTQDAQIADSDDDQDAFDANLAEDPLVNTSSLAQDIIDGIESDIRSRGQLIAAYTKGLDMLGLKIEERSGKRQRKNVSTIRHPVMLEAIVDFQSAANGELLPAAGPAKVMIGGGLTDQNEENLAQQLEDDLNYYLTTTATEYYPDTDRGFFYLGYGGTLFKKVYKCPLRNRAVSESVYLTDLIVSENATDLDNAIRVTHKIDMSPSDVKRMQLRGVWKNIALMSPTFNLDPVKMKIGSQQGIAKVATRPKDMQHTIYECYTEIVPDEYNLKEVGAPEGMALPYRVTLDKDSRSILEIRRAWMQPKENDEEDCLYEKNLPFVMFTLVPGMGFLGLGFLHLLGNQTLALTAIWRILVDAGMFSNFPGGVKIKGTRQTTNEINPGPGEWPEVDTGPSQDIRQAMMPLPYKEPSQTFIALSEIITKEAQNLISSAKLDIGEGAANVPVGTIMAMIQQQTKNMSAVHKRMHAAQKRELQKLLRLFQEEPEMLFRTNPKARQWKAEELNDVNLVPASDPNVPSQMHRIMLATAKVQLAQQNPEIYDAYQAHMDAWRSMGVDASSFLHQPAPQQQDPAAAITAAQLQTTTQLKQQELQQKEQQQQREAADRMIQAQTKDKELASNVQQDAADRASKEKIAMIEQETERMRLQAEQQNNVADRVHSAFDNHLDRSHNLQQTLLTRKPDNAS